MVFTLMSGFQSTCEKYKDAKPTGTHIHMLRTDARAMSTAEIRLRCGEVWVLCAVRWIVFGRVGNDKTNILIRAWWPMSAIPTLWAVSPWVFLEDLRVNWKCTNR